MNPAYTIGNQMTEGYRRHKGASQAEAEIRAVELLGRVGIANARGAAGAISAPALRGPSPARDDCHGVMCGRTC